MSIKCLLNLSVISSIYCYCRQWSDGQVLLRHGLRQGARHWDRDLSGDRTLEQGGARLSHARMSDPALSGKRRCGDSDGVQRHGGHVQLPRGPRAHRISGPGLRGRTEVEWFRARVSGNCQ